MTNRLSNNLRSGHRAEDLAIVLLRQIGAVAQIPHTEDVGSDAIVTLLPRSLEDSRILNSAQSFWVQIKTKSIKSISLDQQQALWLKNLRLPLFFARMHSKETELEIFSAHNLWELYACGQSHSSPSSSKDKMILSFEKQDELSRWGYLGPPIVSWKFHEIEGPDRQLERDNIVKLFEEWCSGWHRARLLWQVGANLLPDYETGQFPHKWRIVKRFTNEKWKLSQIALNNLPMLESLMMGFVLSGNYEAPDKLLIALDALRTEQLPEYGKSLDDLAKNLQFHQQMQKR